eukprot:336355_1
MANEYLRNSLILVILVCLCFVMINYRSLNGNGRVIESKNFPLFRSTDNTAESRQRDEDIDYSLREMIDTSIVNTFSKITDDINHLSFIFYKSDILDWVTKNAGEKFVRTVFNHVLSENQDNLAGSIMADIGANMGYYGLLSLTAGIGEAMFFDPQPACVQIIESLVSLNAFNKRARIVNHPMGDNEKLEIPTMECGGRFPVSKFEKHVKNAYGENGAGDPQKHYVSFMTADQALGNKTILITKIDTEGAELNILPLLFRKFEHHQLVNVVVEITPFWWKNTGHSIEEGADILSQIIEYGYNGTTLFGTKINTRKEMTGFVLQNQEKQIDVWFHCILCSV